MIITTEDETKNTEPQQVLIVGTGPTVTKRIKREPNTQCIIIAIGEAAALCDDLDIIVCSSIDQIWRIPVSAWYRCKQLWISSHMHNEGNYPPLETRVPFDPKKVEVKILFHCQHVTNELRFKYPELSQITPYPCTTGEKMVIFCLQSGFNVKAVGLGGKGYSPLLSPCEYTHNPNRESQTINLIFGESK